MSNSLGMEPLERYSPFIRYDSLEAYSADSPATMTDCATAKQPHGNVLEHGGKELAAAAPNPGEARLDLEFLRGGKYQDPATTPVGADDYVDVIGKEYVAEAHLMHGRPGMANQIYGHQVKDREGALWLQYWFFYYFNDYALLWQGLHEGDWEMIQLRLGASGEPDAATYAQHKRGERCAWAEVEKQEGAPIVYSARGSHASYFRRGNHATEVPVVGWDVNDAGGPLVRPHLNVIKDDDPSWVGWPGRWGSTKVAAKILDFAVGDDSPVGPRFHSQWRDPLKFHEEAKEAEGLPPVAGADLAAPPAPTVSAVREGAQAKVSFDFPGSPPLKAVLVSIDGSGDGHAPFTKLYEPPPPSGEVLLPPPLEPRPYTARVSGIAKDGASGPVGEAHLPAS